MISDCISDDRPPQMKILNMVIPILMHYCSFVSNWSVTSGIKRRDSECPTKCDVINNVKLFPTLYRRIYSRKFLRLSSQISFYKFKCI